MAAKTTTQRGLGWKHQKNRVRLLHKHRDGARCWWCGEPMYKAQDLAADHTKSRALHNGTNADRLLHDLCNKQRGDGSRDHLRPALTRLNGGHDGNTLDWS